MFASSAKNVFDCKGVLPPHFLNLFRHIKYTQETDQSMHVGIIHSDHASLFPEELINERSKYSVLRDTANFIQVHRKQDGGYVLQHIHSKFVDTLLQHGKDTTPRLVTY